MRCRVRCDLVVHPVGQGYGRLTLHWPSDSVHIMDMRSLCVQALRDQSPGPGLQ
jgi:hypothetical protein